MSSSWYASSNAFDETYYITTRNCSTQFCAHQFWDHRQYPCDCMFTAPKSTHLFTVMEVNLFEKYEAVVQRKLQQLSVHVFIAASTCKQIFLDWTTQLQYCLKFFSYYCGDSISIRENMLTCEKICSLLFF